MIAAALASKSFNNPPKPLANHHGIIAGGALARTNFILLKTKEKDKIIPSIFTFHSGHSKVFSNAQSFFLTSLSFRRGS